MANFFGGESFDEIMDRLLPGRNAPAESGLTLDSILKDYYLPEYERLAGRRGELEESLMKALGTGPDFETFRGELTTMAQSITDELFGAQGPVNQALRGALGETVQSGFGTTSGGFDRARQNIFGQARSEVSNRIAQGALQLAPVATQMRAGDIASLLDFTGLETGRLENLRESLFGGQATIENLGLAKEQLALNRQIASQGRGVSLGGAAQGALAGAAAGSFIPGLGTVAGGILGGLGGLLF